MASPHHNSHSEAAKLEQIITEFFAKSLHIILESRSPYVSSRDFSGEQAVSSPSSSSSSSSTLRPRDKWFNLALRECPAALENLDFWRQNNPEPMVVDVVLKRRPLDWDPVNIFPKADALRNLSSKERYPFCCNSDQECLGAEGKSEKIIERWVVQYETRKSRDCCSGSRRLSSNNSLHALYKKSILLLRSLYVFVRLLPAYKIFRDLNSSGQIHAFKLIPRVSSFVEAFTRKEETEMQWFGFTPVDASCGRLSLSVLYCSSLSELSSEPSTPMSPQFIPDYVGSPLADPLKRFPSLPVSHGSPSSLPFSRRHSWSYDHYYKASPSSIPFSPSPTHSEPHASVSNLSPRPFPPMSLPPHPPETYLVHKKHLNFDEYAPTPFSPSLSPSPPIHIPGNHFSKGLLRSESAPVYIPVPKMAGSPVLASKQSIPLSPSPKVSRASISRVDNNNNMGLIQAKATIEKLFSFEDSRKLSGVRTSSAGSPQISFSRSSSRSFQDDIDDTDFPCPFDVEVDDMTDPGSRPESYDQRGHQLDSRDLGLLTIRKSQDAAVGALVHMLKKAPPLRQDNYNSVTLPEEPKPEGWSSGIQEQKQAIEDRAALQASSLSISSSALITSKTAADALEELRSYKDMRNMLLSQGGRSYASANTAPSNDSRSKGKA